MSFLVVNLLCGFAATIMGAAAASGLWWSHFRRKTASQSSAEARLAVDVLARLHELATRVAADVEEHSSKVEEINDKLTSAGSHEPALIADVVASLIQANLAHAREARLGL